MGCGPRGGAGTAGSPEVRGWRWVPAAGRSGAAGQVSALPASRGMAVRAGAAVAGAAVVAVLSAALALYGPPLDAGTRPRVRAGGAAVGAPGRVEGGRRVTPRARPRLLKRRAEEQGEPDERVLGVRGVCSSRV